MHVLMLSSSRANNSDYLAPNQALITTHLHTCKRILFVPYAGVTVSYDDYTQLVQHALPDYAVINIDDIADKHAAINDADAIAVGGGNTFALLHRLQHLQLMQPIQQAVAAGCRYVGWSAGSNICGATIRTTNDMPIVEPHSFNALNFVPFQLNPHYVDVHPKDFHGETRDQRLTEFTTLHPTTPVIGIREGTALWLQDNTLRLMGEFEGVKFLGTTKTVINCGADLSALL